MRAGRVPCVTGSGRWAVALPAAGFFATLPPAHPRRGPHDSLHLFDRFREMILSGEGREARDA